MMMTGDDFACPEPETRSKKAKNDEDEGEVARSFPNETAIKRGPGRGRRGKK